MLDTRVGRVKVIFRLPTELALIGSHKTPALLSWPKATLAFIEWFTTPTLSDSARNSHNMASILKPKRSSSDNSLPWSIIPLSNIRQSCMLVPNYRKAPNISSLSSSTVLDSSDYFYINNWLSVYTYKTIYKE